MTPLDPRIPVVVGAGQCIQRPEDVADLADAQDVIGLLVDAARNAALDSGAPDVLHRTEYIGVQGGRFPYPDPGRHVATLIGAPDAHTVLTVMGGNTPQAHVNEIAARIQRGELDQALLVGGEASYTHRRARKEGVAPPARFSTDQLPAPSFGEELDLDADYERRRGLAAPTAVYAVFESAIRSARGETLDEHRDRISQLWAEFNAVALENPYSWSQTSMTADEIRNPTPDNRMVGFPYTKVMNANNNVDLASAVLLCSAGRAAELGIARDRWVFVHAGTDTSDLSTISRRMDFSRSPAIRIGGRRVVDLAGVSTDDLRHVDLYSCFPSAVQVSSRELGLDDGRPLTVTGGLTFAGAALNNYSGQALAALIERLRAEPGIGFLHANGGYITKHGFGVFATTPPREGYRYERPQAEVDALPTVPVAPASYAGPLTIEAYTVVHQSSGERSAIFTGRLDDGSRAVGQLDDPPAELTTDEFIGRPAHLNADGTVRL